MLKMDVTSNTKVAELINCVERDEVVRFSSCVVLFRARPLSHDRSVGEYKIEEGSIVSIIGTP